MYDTVKNKNHKELLNPIQYKKKVKKSSKHSTNIHKPPVVNPYLSGVVKLNSEEKFSNIETEFET